MLIYDTLSGKKKKISENGKKRFKLFVCGPTVYDLSHIGHARTYIFFDAFTRYLRHSGFKVFYLQNITNIDDKIIARAGKAKKNPLALSNFFEKEYLTDMKILGVNSVDRYARATDFIPEIAKQIRTLVKKGFAYEIPGDGYYFNISKFKDYGKLSRRSVKQAESATSRIDESAGKKNKGDFCLWKFSKDNKPSWSTSFGAGRPGWHIEDTAITEKFFGPQYDIHGGGADLKFPHHEAEIAQQEAASGKKPLVKIWMHTGMLTVNGKKMSKSLGNFITIKDFLKKYPAETLRFMILSHQYRKPMDYNDALATQTKKNLDDISLFLAKMDFMLSKKYAPKLKKHSFNFPKLFEDALADDFNTPRAVALIFRAIKQGNELCKKYEWKINRENLVEMRNFINTSLAKFGIAIKKRKVPQKIEKIAAQRELFRANKQFIQADALREKILMLGYAVEDTLLGPFIRKQIPNSKS